jgi:hypothetical protein
VSGVAQVATDLGKRHDDDILVERDEEHRERKQCQDSRVPFPANVVFNNSASPWGTIDTHGAAPSSPGLPMRVTPAGWRPTSIAVKSVQNQTCCSLSGLRIK